MLDQGIRTTAYTPPQIFDLHTRTDSWVISAQEPRQPTLCVALALPACWTTLALPKLPVSEIAIFLGFSHAKLIGRRNRNRDMFLFFPFSLTALHHEAKNVSIYTKSANKR